MQRKKGYFSISAVAKMFSVHQQTIRLYEKEGLISPKRSEGNTRLFSEEDVDRLEQVIYLTHKMGVNLAGVELVLKLQKKIKKLQEDMNKLFNQTQGQLEKETQMFKEDAQQYARELQGIKQNNVINAQPAEPLDNQALAPETKHDAGTFNPASTAAEKQQSFAKDSEQQTSIDDWDIEYSE